METNKTTSLVIKEHDFQEAKNNLKKYTDKTKEEVEFIKVPTVGGFFNLGTHKVTGDELNEITDKIQEYLINFNTLSQCLVDEFGQVYKAFESLDKDYITGIVGSIRAAEKVSIEEQKDRKKIKELIEQHKQSIAVLKKFKADIEKLKHLTDIDKAWSLIEEQTKESKELRDYIADLSKLEHIKDVDRIHHRLEQVIKNYAKISELLTRYMSDLTSVCEYCDSLVEIKHLKDVDKIWDSIECAVRDIECIRKSIEAQDKAIAAFDEKNQILQTEQKNFVERINKLASEFQNQFDNHFKMFTNSQVAKLNDIEKAHAQSVKQLVCEQRERLSTIEKTQNEIYDSVIREQSLTLSRVEKTQKEALEQLSKDQSVMLEQIYNEQSVNWENTIKLFEEEKAALNEQVASITQKAKFSYIIAGIAVTLTVVQLVFNVLGIL
ncbi:hypothetical protein [Amedibacterium intestinale]|uniref:hypothetical protein n=1 Tax=Amedibacterium intestinale TaxID=2583452 RepID=UPI000E52742E|nr:hypothetical protein [Amedibacterium intestinale]RHO34358.1 hypothetical protein DW208_01175 [Erysipelotrichaceae bacterium AM17-60]